MTLPLRPWLALLLLGGCFDPFGGGGRDCGRAGGAGSGAQGVFVQPDNRLRIATWNLRWLGDEPWAGEVPRGEEDYQRLRGYAERLDADVVALQEVDGASAAARAFDPGRHDFHFSSRGHEQRTGFAYRKGLRVTPHPDYTALDVGGQRYGADLTLHLDSGTDLRLLSVHLSSGCFDAPLDEAGTADTNAPCRRLSAQVSALEAWIDARAREGAAAVVLGDFNRRFFAQAGGDGPWRELNDGEPPGATLASPTADRRAACWNGKFPQFIDHLVFNRAASPLQARGTFQEHLFEASDAAHADVLSDHCPLSVELHAQACQ